MPTRLDTGERCIVHVEAITQGRRPVSQDCQHSPREAGLVRAVVAGDPDAVAEFFRATADALWAACAQVTRDERQAREAYDAVCLGLAANGFESLHAYDGRSRLTTFVALRGRDLLAHRLLRLLWDDAERGWRAFEAFFAADIERLIRRRLPGGAQADTRREAWQEICVGLVADDYRRLKAFSGAGSFIGFVLHTADRLLLDFIRTFSMRRRLPAAVARLTALEQEVFRCVYWQGGAADPATLGRMLAGRLSTAPDPTQLTDALARVRRALPSDYGAGPSGARFVSLSDAPMLADEAGVEAAPHSPEQWTAALEEERLLGAAAAVLRRAAAALPELERRYVELSLSGAEPLPAREMARLMQRPVEEIYKLKQRVLRTLRESIGDEMEVRNWHASV